MLFMASKAVDMIAGVVAPAICSEQGSAAELNHTRTNDLQKNDPAMLWHLMCRICQLYFMFKQHLTATDAYPLGSARAPCTAPTDALNRMDMDSWPC